eukprot:5091818-Pyramimonas_sp.AAC.1
MPGHYLSFFHVSSKLRLYEDMLDLTSGGEFATSRCEVCGRSRRFLAVSWPWVAFPQPRFSPRGVPGVPGLSRTAAKEPSYDPKAPGQQR